MKEKPRIKTEMEMAVLAYNEAKKQGDKGEKDRQWGWLVSLQKELSTLEKKVMTNYDNCLPDWWNE